MLDRQKLEAVHRGSDRHASHKGHPADIDAKTISREDAIRGYREAGSRVFGNLHMEHFPKEIAIVDSN